MQTYSIVYVSVVSESVPSVCTYTVGIAGATAGVTVLKDDGHLVIPGREQLPSPAPAPAMTGGPANVPFRNPGGVATGGMMAVTTSVLCLQPRFIPVVPVTTNMAGGSGGTGTNVWALVTLEVAPVTLAGTISAVTLMFILFVGRRSCVEECVG